MDKYSMYCTEAQTCKALELGAPINRYSIGNCVICPTAEQMINKVLEWLGMELEYTMNKINRLQKYSQGIKEKIDSLNK